MAKSIEGVINKVYWEQIKEATKEPEEPVYAESSLSDEEWCNEWDALCRKIQASREDED